MINLAAELSEDFTEVTPLEFYRDIFKHELDTEGSFSKNKYTGIACEFTGEIKDNGKELVKRYSITDDLLKIEELLLSNNFIILSPISYVGKSRKSINARFLYAFAIEIDGLKIDKKTGNQDGYRDLIYQCQNHILPTPNYIVASGSGVHLYYIFEKPIPLFKNVSESLKKFKKYITPRFWNRYVTDLYQPEKIQYESVFQGFRLAGGVSKTGERTRVFKVHDTPISIEELNEFVHDDKSKIEIVYKSDLLLKEAKEKYPEWYDRRIVKKEPKGRWTCKTDLYDWWLRTIKDGVTVGHRYYCLMCLCIYAIKCNVPYERVAQDCYGLLTDFDSLSLKESNRFTIKDVADALQTLEDEELVTFPIEIISARSGIEIKKNKRNYRKQSLHLKLARANRDILCEEKGIKWDANNGRKKGSGTKADEIKEWRKLNPEKRKIDCFRETGISRPTIDKWWNSKD